MNKPIKSKFGFIVKNWLNPPDTRKYFRTGSIIVFFPGNIPLYVHVSEYNLTIPNDAGYTLCPERLWQIAEYCDDLSMVLRDGCILFIGNYDEAKRTSFCITRNDSRKESIVANLRDHVQSSYNSQPGVSSVLENCTTDSVSYCGNYSASLAA